ncbi:MAG TPA: aldehyde dehydrogenase family protein, partial [Thermoanaerobaculia bacterium]|nr:aldehyde dehydrogenase family protein [Thermoanaerobaculia bacterium]
MSGTHPMLRNTAPEGTVSAAVATARRVQPAWAARPVAERLAVVRRLRTALGERGGDLAALSARTDVAGWLSRSEALAAEVVPLADACAFLVRRGAELLAARRPGAVGRPAWLAGVELEVRRAPHGVVLVVAPSNYPIFLPGVQTLQALAAGNAVLLKPGPRGSTAARWLAAELAAAGLPEGLLTLLPEAPEMVHRAVAAGVDHVVFTGSARTGRALLVELAPHWTPATLELSGCDALVALADADPERVAAALAFSLRLNGGATCIAPRRAYVDRSILAAVETALSRALAAQGPAAWPAREQVASLLPETARPEALATARRLVAEAVEGGAWLLVGSLDPEAPPAPLVVVVEPPAGADLLTADLFAPVVALVPVASEDEAVRLAETGPYALGASVFGGEAAARRVAD